MKPEFTDRDDAQEASPSGTLGDLVRLLDLRRLDGPDAVGEAGGSVHDHFIGQSQRQPWRRIYGGQVLAQALVAVQRTVDADRPVHSMHAYFLRAGDDTEPITFSVERLRDGQSFSARRVHAVQFERPILTLAASFQQPAVGLDHAEPMPDGVPDPESLPTLRERYPEAMQANYGRWLRERPMDLRHVYPPPLIEASDAQQASQLLWMRTIGALADDPALHTAVLAYSSDYSMLEPVLRRHGRSFADPGLRVASLDHSMWFHRPARVDQWLLWVFDSPSASGARGLGRARVYTRDGELVATVAQEGMMRFRDITP